MAIPRLRKRSEEPIQQPIIIDRAFCLYAIAVLVVVIVAFIPALKAGFIWDDDDHFTKNPYVADPNGLVTIWTSAKAIYYPLTLTTWWVMRRLVDLNPFPYHLITVLFHAANAVLLAGLLRRLAIPGALLAGLVFALHPMQVESVAWATELKNTQSGLFFFLAIHAFLSAEERLKGGRRWVPLFIASVLAGLCAILSKPSTVPLPGVLLVLAIWRHGFSKGALARVVPFVLLALLSAAWTIYEQKHHSNAKGPEWEYGFLERLVIAGRAFWFYLGKFVAPRPLIFIYPRWEPAVTPAMLHLGWLLVVLGTAALSLGCLYRKSAGLTGGLVAWLIYGGLLVPVLGFFNIYFNRFSFVADHFAYLALIVPCAVVGAAVAFGIGKLEKELQRFGWAAACMIPLLLGAMSFQQSRLYNDEVTLWSETLKLNPSAWIAHNNLGFALTERGQFAEAMPHFEAAIRLKPNYEEAYNNLGYALLELERPADAIEPLRRATELRQPYPDALLNLANALAGIGDLDGASNVYTGVVANLPHDAIAHMNFGAILAMQGRYDEALSMMERARKLDPQNRDIEKAVERLRAVLSKR
ncbi:tetratricopeptide repeat protein [bacterium]|nr:tetratricopeptide repeat protein [bacterium]